MSGMEGVAEAKKREKGYGKAKTGARTAYLANT